MADGWWQGRGLGWCFYVQQDTLLGSDMNSTTLQFTGKCVLPLYKYSVVSVYISTYLYLYCFDKKNETNKNIFRFCLGASLTLSFSSYFHISTRIRHQKLLWKSYNMSKGQDKWWTFWSFIWGSSKPMTFQGGTEKVRARTALLSI